jgi:hypothetical protein
MKALEYVLDSTNQKRKRKDKDVKKAWGYAFAMKGLIYDVLGYYQPTLLVYHYDGNRKQINPTWTKRAKKIYTVCQHAKQVNMDYASRFKTEFGMERIKQA